MRNFQRTNGREVLNFYKEGVPIDLNIYRNGIAANLAAEMMMTRTPGDAKKTTKRKKEAIERAKICRKTIPKYVIKCMQNCRNRDSPLNTAIASKEHPFADILRASLAPEERLRHQCSLLQYLPTCLYDVAIPLLLLQYP
jgi:hypothetical protein